MTRKIMNEEKEKKSLNIFDVSTEVAMLLEAVVTSLF